MWNDYKKGAEQYRILFEPIREFKIKQKQQMMKRKIILALREVAERMDDLTPMHGEDWLEIYHFLQSKFVEHSSAICTKVEVRWNGILHDQDFWLHVWRFKEGTSDFDFSECCGCNPEFMMDEDALIGQRLHVKWFINKLIDAV